MTSIAISAATKPETGNTTINQSHNDCACQLMSIIDEPLSSDIKIDMPNFDRYMNSI